MAAMANFWSLLNNLVWIFGKSLYWTTSTIFCSNSRSLEQPGLIIEILEYVYPASTCVPVAHYNSATCSQTVSFLSKNIVIWLKTSSFFTEVIIFSPNPSFWTKKVSSDDFFMTIWKQENKSERKKEPQVPRLWNPKFTNYPP